MKWHDIKTLDRVGEEVLIFAPDETPNMVMGVLTKCEDTAEHYVAYVEQMMNDVHGEILNPTRWAEKPPTPQEQSQ